MTKPSRVRLLALVLAAAVMPAIRSPLRAQGAQPQVQLAFGYECGDRFLVRNDGARDVDIEYGVAGTTDRWPLHLKGKEQAEIFGASNKAIELRVNGQVVSTAHNGNRPCAATQPTVVVRPIEEREYVTAAQPVQVETQVVYVQPQVVYVEPAPVYVVPRPVYYYPSPSISVVLPFFTHFGGYGRTVVVTGGHGPYRGPYYGGPRGPIHAVPRGRRH